jgi:hypothetical protein
MVYWRLNSAQMEILSSAIDPHRHFTYKSPIAYVNPVNIKKVIAIWVVQIRTFSSHIHRLQPKPDFSGDKYTASVIITDEIWLSSGRYRGCVWYN